MAIKKKSGLGRGLNSLIPQADEPTKTVAIGVANKVAAVAHEAADGSTVSEISLDKIEVNPDQPRTVFGHQGMEDLTSSVKEHGIIQPLALSPRADGKYEVIAGERRFRAAQMAGLTSVPAVIRKVDSRDKLVLALIENIQREDLNPIEEARAYRRLMNEFGLTQEAVAGQVGKARSTVANTVRLLDLPDEMLDAVATGAISAGSARALLSVVDPNARRKMFRQMVSGSGLTVREAEDDARRSSTRVRKSPQLLAAEEDLRDRFGTKATITERGGKGKITLQFFSEEEYQALIDRLLS
ncbi:MAG: ParB/RepB/Spo0J family partition protein [bacterium]